jgi:hypothetical protein
MHSSYADPTQSHHDFTEAKARKQVASQISLNKKPPSAEEMLQVHELYQEYIKYLDKSFNVPKPSNVIWMKDTVQSNLVMCMPQVGIFVHNDVC